MRWMPYSAPSLRMALPFYSLVTSTCCWTSLSPLHFSPCFSPLTSPWLNPHPPTRLVTNWTWSSLGTASHPTLRIHSVSVPVCQESWSDPGQPASRATLQRSLGPADSPSTTSGASDRSSPKRPHNSWSRP
ncbi:hypothetical protein AAFF_G00203360 [Aldrovandia affinis]|uniref:Secreted protein n=1 Tax=Aldrovandia affinis TaxID=143900 RepID=A0AAD7WVC7_9TELE|nr:hypothetical protein AAFF_G00203360 [Aldrovandia affinis]